MKKGRDTLIQKNKKAYYNYEISETLEVGISLVGTEVKSIREGRCSFSDSYVSIKNGSLVLVGFVIQPYSHGNIFNHESSRMRMLLANKSEIKRFQRKVNEKGMTIVPLEIYSKKGLIKMTIGLARGKNVRDKRDAIKERDLERDKRRTLKEMREY